MDRMNWRTRETLRFFIQSVANHQKIEGDPLVRKILEKCRTMPKKCDFLVSPGIVCYEEKKEKPFWFSSLDQQE